MLRAMPAIATIVDCTIVFNRKLDGVEVSLLYSLVEESKVRFVPRVQVSTLTDEELGCCRCELVILMKVVEDKVHGSVAHLVRHVYIDFE